MFDVGAQHAAPLRGWPLRLFLGKAPAFARSQETSSFAPPVSSLAGGVWCCDVCFLSFFSLSVANRPTVRLSSGPTASSLSSPHSPRFCLPLGPVTASSAERSGATIRRPH